MNPSNQLRLSTMIRAVQESILPAIRDDAPLAKEQAALLMGHLAAMMQQDGREHEVLAREEALLKQLAKELIVAAAGDSALIDAVAAVESALAEGGSTLSFAVERLLSNVDAGEGFKKASTKLTLTYSQDHTNLGRAWFLPMGFDSAQAGLPSLDEQLMKVTS